MSNQDVDGTIRVSIDGSAAVAGSKKIAAEVSKNLEVLGQRSDKVTATIENNAKKTSKAMDRINQSFTNQQSLIGTRRASTLDVESARQAGFITQGNVRFRAIEKRGEESRKTINLMFENNKALADLRETRIEARRLERLANAEKKKQLQLEEATSKQLAAADKFRTQEAYRQLAIADRFRVREDARQVAVADRFRSSNLGDIRAEIIRREGRQSPNLAQFGAAGGGGGGLFGGVGRRLLGGGGGGIAGGFLGGLASGFGIGLGGMAVARGMEGLVNAAQQATAYERQQLAAEKLAGSQGKLNRLLEEYTRSSGGAISKATSLANVTRLLATGFAESVPELERFVKATRGAAISLGKPQEEISQETQLAISNTSVKRLDQIGLGIEEVQTRIEELRESNASWTREMAFQEAVLSLMEEKYGALSESIEGQATGIEKLIKSWEDLGLAIGKASKGPLGTLMGMMAEFLDQLARTAEIGEMGGRIAAISRTGTTFQEKLMHPFSDPREVMDENTARFIISQANSDRARHVSRRPGTSKPWERPEDQQAMIDASYDAIAQVEKQANIARLQEIENYESQRESIINSYGKSIVREEQDFARQRARSLRDYEKNVLDVMRDAQDREAEMQEDLDRHLADAREDSDERLLDLNESYNEQREKAEKEHRDALMKAAGQLDAIAVLEERKQFKRQQEEQKKQHEKSVENEKESLQERIDDALEAHAERLQDARDADKKRLEDMRVARAQQLADEDEDRAIRLQRAAEDHQDQLNELDRQHAARLEQIKLQAEEDTKAIEDALGADLAAMGVYIKGYAEIMKQRDKLIEDWFDKVIERIEDELEERKASTYSYDPRLGPQIPHSYAKGGIVPNTGLAYLHAGEYVIPAGSDRSSNYSNRSLTIGQGAFSIYTTPGMEHDVAEQVERVLIDLLERV